MIHVAAPEPVRDLRALRLDAGLSQSQLGRLIGRSKGDISLFETGCRVPPPELVRRLAAALNLDPAGLGPALEASLAGARPLTHHGPPCRSCGRRIDPKSRRAAVRGTILAEPDYCGPCGRPLSEAAIARAPRDGFVADYERRSDLCPLEPPA